MDLKKEAAKCRRDVDIIDAFTMQSALLVIMLVGIAVGTRLPRFVPEGVMLATCLGFNLYLGVYTFLATLRRRGQ